MVGASVVAIGFIGIWMALAQCLNVARAHRETIAATECLMQRAEEARAVGWASLTSASGIQNNIFNVPPANATALPNLQETISVSIYPPVTPAPLPLTVQRNSDGTVRVVSQPPAQTLRSILAVRVDFSVTWKNAQSGRQRLRQISTVIALGGLLQ